MLRVDTSPDAAPAAEASAAPPPEAGRDRALRDPALLILLALAAAWGARFIFTSSFVVEGRRWFSLFDDAMISMTYVRELVAGRRLRWAAAGPPVEGFTHPLWLLAMLPAQLLPLPAAWRSLPVQVESLLCLLASLIVVRRLVSDHFVPSETATGGRPLGALAWLPAAVATALYYPLAYWSLMGMETGLQALLCLLAVQLALDATSGRRQRHLALWLVCAAAYLLRMDMLLMVAAVQAWVVLGGGVRPPARKRWLAGLGLFVVAAAGYEIFRWVYFHDLLPNTYYLKLAGVPLLVRLLRGRDCLLAFLVAHLPLLLPLLLGVLPHLRRDRRPLLPLGLFALYAAYVMWVGGDVWEGEWDGAIRALRADRFLAFTLPLVFVVGNGAFNAALARWRPLRARRAVLAMLGVALFAVVAANGLLMAGASRQLRLLTLRARPPLVREHAEVVSELRRFQRLVMPTAVVASAWAGIPAYFSDYRMVDLLGYNDRAVAHGPVTVPVTTADYQRFIPGHVKLDVRRALEVVRPDAFFQVWDVRHLGPAHLVMPAHGYRNFGGFWMRKDSRAVLWRPLPWRQREPRPATRRRRGATDPAADAGV